MQKLKATFAFYIFALFAMFAILAVEGFAYERALGDAVDKSYDDGRRFAYSGRCRLIVP